MQSLVSRLGIFNVISPSNSALHEVKDKINTFQQTVQFHLHICAYQISNSILLTVFCLTDEVAFPHHCQPVQSTKLKMYFSTFCLTLLSILPSIKSALHFHVSHIGCNATQEAKGKWWILQNHHKNLIHFWKENNL